MGMKAGPCLAIGLGAFLVAASVSGLSHAAPQSDALKALRVALTDRYPALKAVLIERGGCPVFEFYKAGVEPDTRLPLHSMTKSVLSALIGLAIDHGDLSLTNTIGEIVPEAAGLGIDPRVRGITVRQLMTMTAGLDAEAKPPSGMMLADLWRWSLTRPILSEPGRDFRYDNFGANLLSVMLTKRIGQSAAGFAQTKLFDSMDIRNYTWLDDGDGHSVGAYGLWMTARDMAKIGVLYLQRGRWTGKQVVPESFVASSTRKQNDGGPPFYGAYGYFWWIKPTKSGPMAFFAAGSDGQLIYGVPKLDLVIVIASDKSPEGGVVAFANDVILPAAIASKACGRTGHEFR